MMTNDAEKYNKLNKYSEAAKLFEAEADSTNDVPLKICRFRKAASSYHEYGSYDEEARCLMFASDLLYGEKKIDCLVSCWRVYITAIAVYQYDAGFEWKGEVENLDPSYSETIQAYYSKAVDVLQKALKVNGVDKARLLDALNAECTNRHNEGGWAASEYVSSVEEAFKRS